MTLTKKPKQSEKVQLDIDTCVPLDIHSSKQFVHMRSERQGLPPLLIVQAGPGFPLLSEMRKYQQRLNLERDFLVLYWEQRGCGAASQSDAQSVSMPQQLEDLLAVLRWAKQQTGQTPLLLGVSLGATLALQAAALAPDCVRGVVAVSPDAHTANSDATAAEFLAAVGANVGDRGYLGKLKKLGAPPYTTAARFQLRAELLSDQGGIERGKTFKAMVLETLLSLLRTYGPVGTFKALRNMNLVQNRLLPELASLNLLAHPPYVTVPVHYFFGAQDPLTSVAMQKDLPAAIGAPQTTVEVLQQAAHMLHFDCPAKVRAACLQLLALP